MDRDLHRAHADLDESHWWFAARRRVIAATIRRHVVERGQVLDIGCGAGGLLGMLEQFGPVVAIEADAGAAATAASRHPNAHVSQGVLPDALAGAPVAALGTAFDVIEHLDDDVATLTLLRKRLEPTGSLCVTVPALPWLWSEHDVANLHRRRYTRRTLRAALEAAGFDVVHLSYFNTVLFPLVAAARLAQRFIGKSGSGDFDRSLGAVDRVLEMVFGVERFVVPRLQLPIGVSLIAVARPERT